MGKMHFGRRCLRRVRSLVRKFENWLTCQYDAYYPVSDTKARIRRIGVGYRGSDAEWSTVKKYWKRFGIKPQRIWYALYCAKMGAYDPRFIPDPIWFGKIIPFFNNYRMIPCCSDKGMYNRLITGVKKPETIVKRMAGYYYNGDGEQLVTREEAESLCKMEDHLIIKPSGGSKGAGILFYDKDDNTGLTISAIIDSMTGNFVVQRIVKQHADLSRVNPDSLNTIRIVSFHYKNRIHILSEQLRFGNANMRIDNISAGGNAVAIKPDGSLYEKSVNHDLEWADTTPGGIKLSEVRIPNYQEIIDTIKRLHCQLPFFDIVGWDFAIGEDGVPILIEFNTKPGQNHQISGGKPTLGDLTDEVLEDVFIRKYRSTN